VLKPPHHDKVEPPTRRKYNMIRNKKGELTMNTKERAEMLKEY